MRPCTRPDGQRGFLTIEQIAVAGLGLVLFTWCANLVLFQYARAVTRLAVDEGARAAITVPADAGVGVCTDAATAALDDLLRGTMGQGISVACELDGEFVRASASGAVTSWVPGLTSFGFSATAVAVRDPAAP